MNKKMYSKPQVQELSIATKSLMQGLVGSIKNGKVSGTDQQKIIAE